MKTYKRKCDGEKKEESVKLARDLHILVILPTNQNYLVLSSINDIKENGLIQIGIGQEDILINANQGQVFLCGSDDFTNSSDLTQLQILNHGTVLHCIRCRYNSGIFYTSAGCTLVAVNPFQSLPHLYSDEVIFDYHQQKEKQTLPPHIFNVASKAFLNMVEEHGNPNQSVVVSGESGAGKTYSARFLIKYLTTISSLSKCKNAGKIEQRILQSTPILEAFGNAATIHNHNSSRFGKFIQLQFCKNELQGASIQTFLLEKTRVVYQAMNERNFNIFYQMLNGSCKEEKDLWHLSQYESFKIIPSQNVQCIKDKGFWKNTCNAMTDIGLDKEQQNNIFKILSAILHLSNINFVEDEDGIIDQSKESLDSVQSVTNLLGVSSSLLITTLMFRKICAAHGQRKSIFQKPCSANECLTRRDCLSKFLYERLFHWLVQFINGCINSHLYSWQHFIGILDVYGFESFETNSLEQLCINYANEKLQQYFVKHFLKNEQLIYEEEGLPWVLKGYSDNQSCVDLLEGKISIFGLLDEECKLNRPNNCQFLTERIFQTLGNHQRLCRSKPKNSYSSFIINHYVADVDYCADGLVEKNKDNIPLEFIELTQNSSNVFLQDLLPSDFVASCLTNCDGRNKRQTVLSKFKASLDKLMKTLESSTTHYVRCIKPNKCCQAGLMDAEFVMDQLKACGVLESVTINKSGYPTKMNYKDYVQHYSVFFYCNLLKKTDLFGWKFDENENPISTNLLQKLEVSLYLPITNTPIKVLRRRTGLSHDEHLRKLVTTLTLLVLGPNCILDEENKVFFGKSRIFLTDKQVERLEVVRIKLLSHAAFIIQCWWRRIKRFHANKLKKAATKIQSVIKMFITRKHWIQTKKSAIIIQRAYRKHIHKKLQKINKGQLIQQETNFDDCFLNTQSSKPEFLLITCNQCCGIINITCQCDFITSVTVRPKSLALCQMIDSIMTNQNYFEYNGYINSSSITTNTKTEVLNPISVNNLWIEDDHRVQQYHRLPHLFYWNGLLSVRRMPKIAVRFHTRHTPLPFSHYLPMSETQCSLTDILDVESSM